jgi:hypothetical protein
MRIVGCVMDDCLSMPTTRDTRAASLDAMGHERMSKLSREVVDVVQRRHMHGDADMSMREIQAVYERLHGKRIEMSTISSTVNRLVTSGRLARVGVRRCAISGREVMPVCVVAKQAALNI